LVPQEHGGAGMTMVEAGGGGGELGAALHPGPWLSGAVVAARALSRRGGGAGAGPPVARIVGGCAIATVGPLSGPRPVFEDGVLHGHVTAVPDVVAARVVLVLADDSGRTGLYVVDTTSDGVCAGQRIEVDPTRKLFDVTFDDVEAR